MALIYFVRSFAHGQLLGSTLFVVFLAMLVGLAKAKPYKSPHALVGAPLLFVGGTVLMTFVSIMFYEAAPFLLYIFASPMNVLGYYPPGPDADYFYAAGLWFFSMLGLMAAGLFLGLGLRALRARESFVAEP